MSLPRLFFIYLFFTFSQYNFLTGSQEVVLHKKYTCDHNHQKPKYKSLNSVINNCYALLIDLGNQPVCCIYQDPQGTDIELYKVLPVKNRELCKVIDILCGKTMRENSHLKRYICGSGAGKFDGYYLNDSMGKPVYSGLEECVDENTQKHTLNDWFYTFNVTTQKLFAGWKKSTIAMHPHNTYTQSEYHCVVLIKPYTDSDDILWRFLLSLTKLKAVAHCKLLFNHKTNENDILSLWIKPKSFERVIQLLGLQIEES